MNPKEYVYTKSYKNMYTAIADLEYRKRNSKTIKRNRILEELMKKQDCIFPGTMRKGKKRGRKDCAGWRTI